MTGQDYELLKQRLLGIGGQKVTRQTPQLPHRTLHDRGRHFRTFRWQYARRNWLLPNECHGNSASLWKKVGRDNGWKVVTGYGLGADGLWEPHSWLIDPKTKTIKETTVSRKAYFGVVLTAEETERWFDLVCRHWRRFRKILQRFHKEEITR